MGLTIWELRGIFLEIMHLRTWKYKNEGLWNQNGRGLTRLELKGIFLEITHLGHFLACFFSFSGGNNNSQGDRLYQRIWRLYFTSTF